MSRYYIVQWCDAQRGWVDLPDTAALKEHACIREMRALHERANITRVMRVTRKPHGWVPTTEVPPPRECGHASNVRVEACDECQRWWTAQE